jgi:hypothetical protein
MQTWGMGHRADKSNVVKTQRDHFYPVINDIVNYAMFIGYAAAPVTA